MLHDVSHDPTVLHDVSHDPTVLHDVSHDLTVLHDVSHDPTVLHDVDLQYPGRHCAGFVVHLPANCMTNDMFNHVTFF